MSNEFYSFELNSKYTVHKVSEFKILILKVPPNIPLEVSAISDLIHYEWVRMSFPNYKRVLPTLIVVRREEDSENEVSYNYFSRIYSVLPGQRNVTFRELESAYTMDSFYLLLLFVPCTSLIL